MAMTALDYEGIRQLLARYSVARGEGLAVPSDAWPGPFR
jgi:hypothetical protein